MTRLFPVLLALCIAGCTIPPQCGPVGVPKDKITKWQNFSDDWVANRLLYREMEAYFEKSRNPEVAYQLAYLYAVEERPGSGTDIGNAVARADDLTRFAARCGVSQAAHWLSIRYRYGRRGLPQNEKKANCLAEAAAGRDRNRVADKVAECYVPFLGFRRWS